MDGHKCQGSSSERESLHGSQTCFDVLFGEGGISKKTGVEPVEFQWLRFSSRVTRMDKIYKEYIKRAAQVEELEDKAESGLDVRRDSGYAEQKMLNIELPVMRQKRKTSEEVHGCSEQRHARGWCDRRR